MAYQWGMQSCKAVLSLVVGLLVAKSYINQADSIATVIFADMLRPPAVRPKAVLICFQGCILCSQCFATASSKAAGEGGACRADKLHLS